MAGSAQLAPRKEIIADPNGPESTVVVPHSAVQEAAARLYGQGLTRSRVAKILVNHLVPNGRERPIEQRMSQARRRLKDWEHTDKFRDLIYALAVVKLDMEVPGILDGVARKAKRGRVDAARLALELTGRHNPKGEQQPTNVQIVFAGMPRPSAETITVEAIEEEDV